MRHGFIHRDPAGGDRLDDGGGEGTGPWEGGWSSRMAVGTQFKEVMEKSVPDIRRDVNELFDTTR